MSSAHAAAPRLLRAVADSTQPYGPLLEGNAVHTLQEYLADPSQIDTVYRTVLDRASGEPLRFKASQEVLHLVEMFCIQAGATYGSMSAALHRSITYLQALVVRLIGSQRQHRLAGQPPTNAQHQKSASDTPVALASANLSRTASTPVPELAHKRSSGSVVQLLNARLSLTMEEGSAANWAIHHDMATARFGSSQPNAAMCHRMAAFLPSLPAYAFWPDMEAGGEQDPADRFKSSAEAVQAHVQGIAALQRVQASQEGYNADPAVQAHRPKLRDNRPRLLFQYLPYTQQEVLQLAEPDIQAVLESNFGAQGLEGTDTQVHSSEEVWGNSFGRPGRGTAGSGGSQSAGQVCASILVKLMIDMYLKAGPAVAYPLALLMLQRASSSHSSSTRARPFDVLYNLSVHGEMLYPASDDPTQMVGGERDPDSVLEQAWAQSSSSGQWPLPGSLNRPLHVFQTWLRHLLWELSSLAAQRGETSPEVWEAVLGCLIQLSSHNGYTVRAFLEGISQKVVAALLRCCVQQRWSEEVYCQIIRLAVNLLYVPHPTQASSDEDDNDNNLQGDASKPAAHLQLSGDLLAELGGISLLTAHFKQAPTTEACRNLLAVMLDYVSLRLVQGGESGSDRHEEAVSASLPVYSQEGLAAVMPVLTANHAPAALQAAAQVGDAGFASTIAHVLQQSLPLQQAGDGSRMQAQASRSSLLRQQPSPEHLVSVLVDQLEALTCSSPDSAIPASLQAIVDHTLHCVRCPYLPTDSGSAEQQAQAVRLHEDARSPAEGHVALDEAWQCLAELLCDEDDYAASVGQTWLYRLLVEVAKCHMSQLSQQLTEAQPTEAPTSQYDDQDSSKLQEPYMVGLLPHPLGGPPKPDAPAHLSQQPELAGLLSLVLSQTPAGVDAGHRFATVLRRLVLHLKLKCSAPASGTEASDDGMASPRHHSEASRQTSKHAVQHSTSHSSRSPAESSSHSTAQRVMRSISADNVAMHDDIPAEPLISLGIAPQSLMRTSPALSWGQPQSDTDLARSSSSTVHNRTHSDARSEHSFWQGTAAEHAADADASSRTWYEVAAGAPQEAVAVAPRAPSSVMSTAELTGLLQEGQQEAEGDLNHEGIVLHDAPLLGRQSPASQAQPEGAAGQDRPESTGGRSRQEGGPWQPAAGPPLVFSTLYLAMEWILQAAPANRTAACQDIAQLLLLFLCTPAATDMKKGASPPATPRPAHPTQVTIDIPANDPAHVTIRMPSPHGSVTPRNSTRPPSAQASHHNNAILATSSSLAWSFLNGLVAVPTEILSQVPPVLLVRLLHHLQLEGKGADDNSANLLLTIPQGHTRPELRDLRAALVLLLIARCSVKQTALQEAGGEALFAELLQDGDARVRYHASTFVQQRLMELKAQQYRKALRQLTQQAQQQNDEKLLQNPYLQLSTMLDMRLIDFAV